MAILKRIAKFIGTGLAYGLIFGALSAGSAAIVYNAPGDGFLWQLGTLFVGVIGFAAGTMLGFIMQTVRHYFGKKAAIGVFITVMVFAVIITLANAV